MGTANNLDRHEFERGAVFHPARFDLRALGIEPEATFTIRPTDRVFVMGSCFAQRILEALHARGLTATDGGLDLKYTPHAMLQESRWCLDGGFGESMLARTRDDGWFNGHRHPARPLPTLAEALEPHLAAQTRSAAAMRDADVFVITLGLVESWRDEHTGLWLNETPPKNIDGFAERYRVHRTTHAQNLEATTALVRLLATANPRAKFLLSVSPVPLKATFFGTDVLVSNAYSKATLRSVATEAVSALRGREGVAIDYFPSYELVTLAPDRNDVWEERFPNGTPDGRHVRQDYVSSVIIPTFEQAYGIGAVERSASAA